MSPEKPNSVSQLYVIMMFTCPTTVDPLQVLADCIDRIALCHLVDVRRHLSRRLSAPVLTDRIHSHLRERLWDGAQDRLFVSAGIAFEQSPQIVKCLRADFPQLVLDSFCNFTASLICSCYSAYSHCKVITGHTVLAEDSITQY